MNQTILMLIAGGALVAGMFSCVESSSKANGGFTQAVSIPSPAGVKCYAIQEDGKTVGGNCLPD